MPRVTPALLLACLLLPAFAAPSRAADEADAALRKFGGELHDDPNTPGQTVEFLQNPKLTDADFKAAADVLRRVPDLRRVVLDYTRVTDASLEPLAGFAHLRDVSLKVTRVTDAGLKRLAEMHGLKELDVTLAAVTPDGVAAFRKARPDVKLTASGPGEPAAEAAKLRGHWHTPAPGPDGKPQRDAKGHNLVVAGNDLALFHEGRLMFLCRFTLDPDANPRGGHCKLTAVLPGFNSRTDALSFIYEVDEKTLTLCLGSTDHPDDRPADFTDKAGMLLVFEREGK